MRGLIQLLLVDSYEVLRQGLIKLISTETDMAVVGDTGDLQEAVELARDLGPDVIIMDVVPAGEALKAIQRLRWRAPDARILVLTNLIEQAQVLAAMKAGAHGYLPKGAAAADLIQAIRDVAAGRSAIHPTVVDILVQSPATQDEFA